MSTSVSLEHNYLCTISSHLVISLNSYHLVFVPRICTIRLRRSDGNIQGAVMRFCVIQKSPPGKIVMFSHEIGLSKSVN